MNRIAELRKHKGWSQQDLAVAAGLHVQTISEAERGYRGRPSEATLEAIAGALEVAVDELLTSDPEAAPDRAAS